MNTGARNKAPGHTSLNGSVARSPTTPHGTSTASSLSAPSGGSSPSSPALSSRSSPLGQSCLSCSPSPRDGCAISRRSPFRRTCRARGVCATRSFVHSRFQSPFFCHCHLAARFMRPIPCKHNVPCTPFHICLPLLPTCPPLLHMPFILLLYFMFLYTLRLNCTCNACTNNKTHTL